MLSQGRRDSFDKEEVERVLRSAATAGCADMWEAVSKGLKKLCNDLLSEWVGAHVWGTALCRGFGHQFLAVAVGAAFTSRYDSTRGQLAGRVVGVSLPLRDVAVQIY